MHIANPMYDAIFKHLLEDTVSAKLIIGAILGEEIEALELMPQESAVRVRPREGEEADFTVQRIDFAATVRTAAGERLRVLVEVQKSHYSDDVMRFRRYLGQHYADERAYVTMEGGRERHHPLRLTTIYFLGRRLPCTDATVLKVTREYLDAVTGERLEVREEFVESLTHECYVVQVPLLTDRRRTDLERLLSVFDQKLRTDSRHVLEVDETWIPPEYGPVLRRLQRAAASRELELSMRLEDEVVEEWMRMERDIAQQKEALAQQKEALAQQKEALAQQKEALAQQKEALAQRDGTITQQKEALAQRDGTITQQKEALAQRDETLAQRDETLAQRDETLAQRDETLERQQAEIEALRRRLDRQGR